MKKAISYNLDFDAITLIKSTQATILLTPPAEFLTKELIHI